MARENQGLQIALIIFVMLTIILGVTTFIFFRQYEEAELRAQQESEKAAQNNTTLRNIQTQNDELKRLIGVDASKGLDEILNDFNTDMQTYGGNFPDEARFYRPLVQYLAKTISDKNVELVGFKDELDDLKGKYAEREASKDTQIQTLQQAADEAGKELAQEQRKFKNDRTEIQTKQEQLQTQLASARKEASAAVAKIQEKLKGTTEQIQKLAALNIEKTEKLEALNKETFEVPDGEIRWVNQRNGTVWLNLGRADALNRQTNFAVYPADTSDMSHGGKKASIEITQILGDHLAEARILEDDVANPILPGDKIHTPVWTPGERKHFALTGMIDLDGDGRSDQSVVRNLITMSGGVVDSESEKGQKKGRMSINTRYLVLGDAPDAKSKAGDIAAYTEMIGEAERLGVPTIPLKELMRQMGWKNHGNVVTFGTGANPQDFAAKPEGGVSRVSQGNVSEIFAPRKKPLRSAAEPRGAY